MDYTFLFYGLLFLVALFYASVGHGGASGYLALMALFSFSPEVMKPTALLLNLFVSLSSFLQFYRGGHFKWNIFLPLAISSVPLAYAGGSITVQGEMYKKMLGLVLLIPVIRFLFFANVTITSLKKSNVLLSVIIGSSIGFLSGLIGIGGGIILSPVLLLLKWTDQKQTAAISAPFIFVNSFSGLMGQLRKGIYFTNNMYFYVAVAFMGGLCGAYLGSLKFNQGVLKYMLVGALLLASCKLLFGLA